jgi:hypothetical protein
LRNIIYLPRFAGFSPPHGLLAETGLAPGPHASLPAGFDAGTQPVTKNFAFLITAAALMGATPALAQTVCVEPEPPVLVDGKTISHDALVGIVAQVKEFRDKSDVYQQCIANDLEAKKAAAAKAGTPFDEQIHQVAMAKVAANQELKDMLVADTNAQIVLYQKKAAAK